MHMELLRSNTSKISDYFICLFIVFSYNDYNNKSYLILYNYS